ncbi:MAG TPA: hypothetical protein VGZ03_04785 [Acidimicrobiales bacterium]|nr:hypothetical protein [Acidimicrobiales bacterium]
MTSIDGSDTEAVQTGGRLRAFRASATWRRQQRARANLSAVLVCFDLLVAAMVAANLHGPARVVGGLAFCVVVPGWAIVGPLRLRDPALEAGLTIASSLCALMVVAQLASTLGGWHLTFLQLFVCGLCLPSLVWQTVARRRPPDDAR